MKGKKPSRTSFEVASMAGRQLRDPSSTPEQKSVAASALRQRQAYLADGMA